ncbi:MAG TPA: hypothetical protein PLD03_06680 [Thiomonas arsenitoxydans]|nr:hypothetical protein [Thiomonas arsenitoxydans]
MTDDKHCLRRQVSDEIGASLSRAIQRDRKSLVILLLQIVNAVWFAVLWEHRFEPVAAVGIWAVFFAASITVSIAIEKRRS